MAEVTQADREAARKVLERGDGVYDLAEDFARHRTEAMKPLVEALKEIGAAATVSAALNDPDERATWDLIASLCEKALRSVQS